MCMSMTMGQKLGDRNLGEDNAVFFFKVQLTTFGTISSFK